MKSLTNLPVSTATNLICTHLLTSSHRSNSFSRYLTTFSNQNSFFLNCLVTGWNGNISATNEVVRFFLSYNFNTFKESMFISNFYNNITSSVLKTRFRRSSRTLRSVQLVSHLRTRRSSLKTNMSKRFSTFTHKSFLSLEKSFLKSALPLSTPYRNLFSGVFDWDGKGFQELSLNSKLLDLHHKVVRRKVFLNVLHKLTRKVRVVTKTPTYQFNYKNYSLFKEGGLVTNRYMKINPRQTSFLNNRSLRDQGWGTFLPCKIQILSAFFKTYRRLVTHDLRSRARRIRFNSDPLFVVGVNRIVRRFDHFFKKLPQVNLNLSKASEFSLNTKLVKDSYSQGTYLNSSSLQVPNRTYLPSNTRGFQKNLSFNQLRFRSSRQNRPQLKASTKAVWSSAKRYNPFTSTKSVRLANHNTFSSPSTSNTRGSSLKPSRISSPITLNRVFSSKHISKKWGLTSRLTSSGNRLVRCSSYRLLASHSKCLINLKLRLSGRQINLPKRHNSRRIRRFTRSVQYKLRGLTGSKLDRGLLSLLKGLVLRTPTFSRVFRMFFWSQSVKSKNTKPLNNTISHPHSSLRSVPSNQPSHFVTKSVLNLLVRRCLRIFKLVSTYSTLGNFSDKRRILINMRSDRARKYKRSRRKRRVSALSVLDAETYLSDVRYINTVSSQSHLNTLSSLMITTLHLSRSPNVSRSLGSKVVRYSLYNSKSPHRSLSGKASLGWFRRIMRTGRRFKVSKKELLLPTQLPFRRRVFLTELLNYVSPTASLVKTASFSLSNTSPNTLLGYNFFSQKITSNLFRLPYNTLAGFNWLRLLSTTRLQLVTKGCSNYLFSNILKQSSPDTTLTSRSFKFMRAEIISYYDLPFIFSNVGFLFLSTNTTQVSLDSHYDRSMARARINKHRLSFFIKNDIKRVYLKRPGLLKLLSSFMEDDSLTNVDLFFSSQWRLSQGNLKEPNTRLASQFFNSSIEPGRYLNQYSTDLGDGSLAQPLSVKRIRFKPGYQRIWRRAREAINFTLNFNCRYQIGLTKRLMWLRRLKRTNALRLQEVTLQKTLLNSHFVFDLSSSLALVQSNTVYVNGINSKNPNLKLFVGDFIQLIVSLRYYIVYRWLINWNNYHNLRFRKLLNFKNNSSRSDLSKQVSRHLPDWIFTIGYKTLDIPKYLEVDYFTLSAFYIYEPLTLNDYHPLTHLDARPEIYTMYNWKYIT